ncbi:unnamed protein product [Linum tenue]|uniref:Uncharacterized protein n=1 Tax=Linum tenue TaxID=586396 RepID=A0AAV0PMQ6_9ROSI|nr:unnamed protein product [Linum tenue]CAI0472375.1 unnamed protein product [Linum tenue]
MLDLLLPIHEMDTVARFIIRVFTAASPPAQPSTFTATFDPSNPLGIVEKLFDFLAAESDYLLKDVAEKEIAAVAKAAKEKRKRKEEVAEREKAAAAKAAKSNNRLKEEEKERKKPEKEEEKGSRGDN